MKKEKKIREENRKVMKSKEKENNDPRNYTVPYQIKTLTAFSSSLLLSPRTNLLKKFTI